MLARHPLTLLSVETLVTLLRCFEIAMTSSPVSDGQQAAYEARFAARLLELESLIDRLSQSERLALLCNAHHEGALQRWMPTHVVKWITDLPPEAKREALAIPSLHRFLEAHVYEMDLMRWKTQ
jgi:hypothetical protein